MKLSHAYTELCQLLREQALLASCEQLLSWDELTYLPAAGSALRAQQMALLAGLHHERATQPRLGELLHELAAADDSDVTAVVRESLWNYERLRALPRTLVEERAALATNAQQVWQEAFARGDFRLFQPWLERTVALKRHEAACYGPTAHPYDALLADYERDFSTVQLQHLFTELRQGLQPLLAEFAQSPGAEPNILHRSYPLAQQQSFGVYAAERLGYDWQSGRLDLSVHPFSSHIGPGDCRITARYRERDFSEGFFSILHEVGHALYDLGLPTAHFGTPLGSAVSTALHESQARLWENTVGRSTAFWRYFLAPAQRAFPAALGDVALGTFVRAINRVAPTLNRVGADEVTYNLHIQIRFELEIALLSGDLQVSDLPGAWSEAYRRTLGIVPANDTEGCLQDGHWAAGLFGYFPTYALGNIIAAQLLAAARRALPELNEALARGDFGSLLTWLRTQIHQHGQRWTTPQLLQRVTGAALEPGALIAALQVKHRGLRQLR